MSTLQWTERGLFAMHVGFVPAVGTGVHLLELSGEGAAALIYQWPMYFPVGTPACRLSDDGSLAAFVAPEPIHDRYGSFNGTRHTLTVLSINDRQVISAEIFETVPADFRFTNDLRYIFFRQGTLLIRKQLAP